MVAFVTWVTAETTGWAVPFENMFSTMDLSYKTLSTYATIIIVRLYCRNQCAFATSCFHFFWKQRKNIFNSHVNAVNGGGGVECKQGGKKGGVNWGEGVNRGGVNCEGSFPVPVPEKNERGERHPFGPSSFLPPPHWRGRVNWVGGSKLVGVKKKTLKWSVKLRWIYKV